MIKLGTLLPRSFTAPRAAGSPGLSGEPDRGRCARRAARGWAWAFLGLAMAAPALVRAQSKPAAGHDLVLCASINKDYVIGSALVTLSGLYERTGPTEFKHFGFNYPLLYAMSRDPRDRQVFYVSANNGLFLTRDGGRTWRIGTSWDMTESHDVAVDPNAPDTVYLALPDGIAVSTDRGATWPRREKGLPERGKYTQVVEVDRTRAGRVLAGCEAGIFLTENAGQSWRRVLATTATVGDLQQSPHDPKLWVAVTQADGAFISRDGGRNWQKIGGVASEKAWYNLAFDGSNPQRIAFSSWTYGVLTTEDGGQTWNERNGRLPKEHCVFRVGIDPDNGRLYANVYRHSLHISDDFGRNWTEVPGLDGIQVFDFVFTPKAGK